MTEQSLLPAEFIKRKRDGLVHSGPQIRDFIDKYTLGQIPDYQVSAWLMAVLWRGLNDQETLALTEAMLHSGVVVDLAEIAGFKVDKHSTGGVGDKTSLVLGPLVAACGLPVPMISGRGLGHTGGTLDKLESIPGFNTQLSLPDFKKCLREIGVSFIGQTKEICPADKKMYSLRDVTATVESIPLICASIMSKKLAEGIDGLVLDVKYGNGAFMKTLPQAEALAQALVNIGKLHGRKARALITFMGQPLGRFAGNALEVMECVDIMTPEKAKSLDRFSMETRELSLQLSARMLSLSGLGSVEDCYQKAEEKLASGAALTKFKALCKAHGADLDRLPPPTQQSVVKSSIAGYVKDLDTEVLGMIGVRLGAGRAVVSDVIEPLAGLEFHKKIGDAVKPGETLFTVYGKNLAQPQDIEQRLLGAVSWSQTPVPAPRLLELDVL